MFFVSFCERSHQMDLHNKKNDGTFEAYNFTYEDSEKQKITGVTPATPINNVVIHGYMSKADPKARGHHNVYYEEYFAITEVNDDLAAHLLAEWEKSSPLFTSKLIFAEKKEVEAIAKARARLSGGLLSFDTGSRPLNIHPKFHDVKPTAVNQGYGY